MKGKIMSRKNDVALMGQGMGKTTRSFKQVMKRKNDRLRQVEDRLNKACLKLDEATDALNRILKTEDDCNQCDPWSALESISAIAHNALAGLILDGKEG